MDFNNDVVDVGEVGFGYFVIVIYEIVVFGSDGVLMDLLCYGDVLLAVYDIFVEFVYLCICYKLFGEGVSELIECLIMLGDVVF